MNWERLAGLRTGALMLLAVLILCGGVSTGAFLIAVPAGWITLGILGFVAFAFLAWVSDPDVGKAVTR